MQNVISIICFLILSTTVFANEEKLSLNGQILIYNTELAKNPDNRHIQYEDVELFRTYVKTGKVKTVRLTSQGGVVGASADIADIVKNNALNTQVNGVCSSGCAIIFINGRKRMLLGESKLGFHTNWTQIDDFEARIAEVEAWDKELDYENTVAYFNRIGAANLILDFLSNEIDLYFALKVLKTHPKTMWYPTIPELEKYGVIRLHF